MAYNMMQVNSFPLFLSKWKLMTVNNGIDTRDYK